MLKFLNIFNVILMIYVIRCIVIGASPSDVGVVLILAGFNYFVYNYKIQSRKIASLKSSLDTHKSVIEKLAVEMGNLSSHVTGMKIQASKSVKAPYTF